MPHWNYSGHFDNWIPESFQLSEDEIDAAISKLNKSEIEDIKFAQNQIRHFAQKQLETMNELEVETLPEYFLATSIYQSKMLGAMCQGGDIQWSLQHI